MKPLDQFLQAILLCCIVALVLLTIFVLIPNLVHLHNERGFQ